VEGRPFSVLGDIKIVVTKAAFLIFICGFILPFLTELSDCHIFIFSELKLRTLNVPVGLH